MFKFFKTKKEKKFSKQEIVSKLNEENKEYLHSFCMFGDMVFIFKGFELVKDDVKVNIITKDTLKNHISQISYWKWELAYEADIKTLRYNWIKHIDQLNKLGLEVKLK